MQFVNDSGQLILFRKRRRLLDAGRTWLKVAVPQTNDRP
jgi:hypothetical protein